MQAGKKTACCSIILHEAEGKQHLLIKKQCTDTEATEQQYKRIREKFSMGHLQHEME